MNDKQRQSLFPLSKLKPEDLNNLYRRTILSILIISISYIVGLIAFFIMFSLRIEYWILALSAPLFGYLWIISIGSKYVNNYYGFKKTPQGSFIYTKKRTGYRTFTWMIVIIFLFSTIVRLMYEINNLLIIKQELKSI